MNILTTLNQQFKKTFLVLLAVVMATTGVVPHASAFDVPFYGSNKILYYDDSDCLPGASPGGSSASVQTGPATATLQEFIKANVAAAIEVNKKYGTPYEAVLAQGSLESANGKSSLAAKYNNFFGIKAGSSWKGQTVDLPTKEEVGGSVVSVVAKFRAFETVQAGWEGYGEFITTNSRYKDALRYPNDPYKYIEEIKKAGYATDSAYVSKVSAIITQIREYVKSSSLGPSATDVAVTPGSPTLSTSDDLNSTLGEQAAVVCCATSEATGVVALSGKDNVEKALNFFMKEVGLNIAQASGVVGNLQQESGASLDPKASNGSHFGIVQWGGGRYANLKEFAKKSGKSWDDFNTQLMFIKVELGLAEGPGRNTEKDGLKIKQAGNDPQKAAELWDTHYERSGGSALDKRRANAKALYDKYKDAPALSGSGSSAIDQDNAPESDDPDTAATAPTTDTTDSASPAIAAANGIVTIAIDPGHNSQRTEKADPVTGITMVDYPNPPEDANVMNVAKILKSKLENNKSMKFKVVLLKNSVTEDVTYRERITRAEQAGASLAVSIHADPSANWTAAQSVGKWRYKNKSYNASGNDSDMNDKNKVVYKNNAVADLSLKYASAIAKSRSTIEKRNSSVLTDMSPSFGRANGRGDLLAYGNIANIMLMSDKVPWIYTEYANPFNPEKYAEGIAQGIVSAKPAPGLPTGNASSVPDSCKSIGSESTPGVAGDTNKLLEFIKKYAWPTYRRDTTMMPDYKTAIARAKKDGRYVGNGGIDCGGFITTLMVDSGFEPKYNSSGKGGNTIFQIKWLDANWQKLGNGKTVKMSELRPGDVAINSGHTFVFVGNNDTYKGNMIASASNGERSPSVSSGAGQSDSASYTWYRKK